MRRQLILLTCLHLAPRVSCDWTGLLGLSFASDDKVEQRQVHCPTGFITGLSVRHGRDHKDDVDTYDFRIRCNKRWGAWSGMSFKALKEEKEFIWALVTWEHSLRTVCVATSPHSSPAPSS